MKINKYPDGTSYINILDSSNGFSNIFKINSYEDLWHLNQFIDALKSKYNGKFKQSIIIPNLIDAQADRRFNKGESSGLKLVCKFLNNMDMNFKIFHPHNQEVVEAMIDNVEIIDNSMFIHNIFSLLNTKLKDKMKFPDLLEDKYFITAEPMKRFYDKRIFDNLILMSSDAGGYKPLIKLCDKIGWKGDTNSAAKSRMYDGKKTIIHQVIPTNDFKGKDILIIDDISIYGGTFKGLSKLLKQRNCGKLYLAVSHMTIQNLGDDPVTNYFDKVFTTNSKFDNYYSKNKKGEAQQPSNLEIIKMF